MAFVIEDMGVLTSVRIRADTLCTRLCSNEGLGIFHRELEVSAFARPREKLACVCCSHRGGSLGLLEDTVFLVVHVGAG